MNLLKKWYLYPHIRRNIALAKDIGTRCGLVFQATDTGLFFYDPKLGKARYIPYLQTHKNFIEMLNQI